MLRTINEDLNSMKKMKDKKATILKSCLTVVGIIVLAVVLVFIASKFVSKDDGKITVEFINGDVKVEEVIGFEEGESIEDLLKENFDNVVFEDGMLMSIEDYVTPSDWSTFISVYVDDVMSEVGLLQVEFKDGTKISLIVTEFIYE